MVTREKIDFGDYFSRSKDAHDALRFLVRCGGYAPSSHNSQPWRFVISDKTIEIWGDERRALPASDPNHRQLFISVGCAIRNICLVADLYGLRYSIERFPDPREMFFAARLRFEDMTPMIDSLPEKHLAFAIVDRHNNRDAYDVVEKIPADFVAEVNRVTAPDVDIRFVESSRDMESVAIIVADATEAAFDDRNFTGELSHWIKPSLKKYRVGMPGYNLGIPWPISFLMPIALRGVNMKKVQRTMAEKMLSAAPIFMVVSTATDTPKDWIAAGEAFEHIWLMAEQRGVRIGVLAAPVQVGEFYKQMQDALHIGGHPQIFCRLGFTKNIPAPSPRLSVNDVIA